MTKIRYATQADREFWLTLDGMISEGELALKTRDRRAYIIENGGPIGVMRYNLMWDTVPFLTLIHLDERSRGQGHGAAAVQLWEDEMRSLGHCLVMTSTQADEDGQHFYRALGYTDRGSLFLDGTPLAQPTEIFMIKAL